MDKHSILKYSLFIVILVLTVMILRKQSNQILLNVSFRDLPDTVEDVTDEYVVHVANEDDLIVPLNIRVNRTKSYNLKGYEDVLLGPQERTVYYSFSLLTNLSNHLPQGVKTLLPRSTKIIDYELNGNYLTLNLSRDFYNYHKENEDQILSVISHTYKENLNVDYIKILVEGKVLRYTRYPNVWLDHEDFKLNAVNQPSEQKEALIVYYYVPIEEEYFLTPVTVYIDRNKDLRTQIQFYLDRSVSLPVLSFPEDQAMKERQYQVSLWGNHLLDEEELSIDTFNKIDVNLY